MDELQQTWGETIASSGRPVVLVTGPATSGKTSIILQRYQTLQQASPGAARIVVPNQNARDDLLARLRKQSDSGVLMGPQIGPFAELGRDILSTFPDTGRSVSTFDRHVMLQSIVADLHAKKAFSTFHSVADTPGLITTLDRAISELKRAAVDPMVLKNILSDTPGKSHDLLQVYEIYQRQLLEQKVFDTEGQLWLVRECLQQAANKTSQQIGLGDVRELYIDGFTDFTPTQLDILQLLAGRLDRLVFTLPLGEDNRQRLWRWTQRTRQTLSNTFGKSLLHIALPTPPRAAESPMQLTDATFDFDPPTLTASPNVHLIAAAGMEAETATVLRRIKRLLLDGVAGDDIILLARNKQAYESTVTRLAQQFELPIRSSAIPLTQVPPIRLLCDALTMAEEGYNYRATLNLLRNNYFQPAALGPFDQYTVAAAEWIIHEGNVLGGKDCYLHAADRLARRLELQTSSKLDDEAYGEIETRNLTKPTAPTVRAAGELFTHLFTHIEQALATNSLAGLAKLCETMGIPQACLAIGDAELAARDLRAVETLYRVAQHAKEQAQGPSEQLPLEKQLQALSQITLPPPRSESMVNFCDVLDARAGRWNHVFLLGCSEGQFPQTFGETSLLNESDRYRWHGKGVKLDLRSDLTAREMLLFYLAVSRTDESITITYRQSDSGGKASAASSFLEAYLAPAGGLDTWKSQGLLHVIPPGQYVPAPAELANDAEALLAGVEQLFARPTDGQTLQTTIPALQHLGDSARQRLTHIASGIWAHHRRWAEGRYNEFDGLLSDDTLREELRRRYPAKTTFSASRLSTYGRCPWQYFAKYILHLRPLEEPKRELEAVSVGIFCHEVLQATFTTLAEQLGRPLVLAKVSLDQLHEAFDAAFVEQAVRVEQQSLAYPALWELQKTQMREQLWEYLRGQIEDDALDTECLHFELGFGVKTDSAAVDAASLSAPVNIDTTAGPIQLTGKIDRVDRISKDGRAGLLVVDYKTGNLPAAGQELAGQNAQMPLYKAALEAMLHQHCLGGAFHGLRDNNARYFAEIQTKKRNKAEFEVNDEFEQDYQTAMETLGRFIRQLQDGEFALTPSKNACSYCDYKRSCHISPVRQEFKLPADQESHDE